MLKRLALLLKVVVSLVWLVASRAVVGGGEACGFKHAAGSEGVGEYGSEIVVKLVGWVSVFWRERGSDVFEYWVAWFFVEECSGFWVNVGVWWEVDVFALSRIGRVVYSERESEVVGKNIVR
jgi:hypothetical protein